MPGQYIWINGWPGVGKLTVAEALQQMLPGSRLIDNHSLIDQVTLPRDHPDYVAARAKLRDAVFASAVHPATDAASATCGSEAAQLEQVLIFTDCFTNDEAGCAWSQTHRAAAARAGRPFLPVYLSCERAEHLKRVARPQRGQTRRKKLLDADVVAGFLDTDHQLFRFPGRGIEVDTTERAPEETARVILEAIKAQQKEKGDRIAKQVAQVRSQKHDEIIQ